MTEYRIMCDHVKTDAKGHSWTVTEQHPIGTHGNWQMSTFRDKAEAETAMKKWVWFGGEYERKCKEMHAIYPDLCETIIHQTNYRIQSRDVTDWE